MYSERSVLCIDENDDHNGILQFFFERSGYKVITCNRFQDSLNYIRNDEFSAFILDIWLDDDE